MIGMVLALIATAAAAEPGSESAFDKLKLLAGEWQADLPGFGTMTNSIRLVSGGKAIEETIGTPAENETSLYTRRNGRILLTHYCAMTPDGRHQSAQPGGAAHAQSGIDDHRYRSLYGTMDQGRSWQGYGLRPQI